MVDPYSIEAQNRHRTVLRGSDLYYESSERKSPGTIQAEEDAYAVTRALMVRNRLSRRRTQVHTILLDTGAGAHIINDYSLVAGYVESTSAEEGVIETFGGHTVTATHIGHIPGFGRVLVTSESDVLLISGS
jgi:hypothetical protein